jgi:hypothetical protein
MGMAVTSDAALRSAIRIAIARVGSVLFYHLVVIAHDKEGRGPLSDEECSIGILRQLEDQRRSDRSKGEAEENAGGNSRRAAFDGAGETIFPSLTAIDSGLHIHVMTPFKYFVECGFDAAARASGRKIVMRTALQLETRSIV